MRALVRGLLAVTGTVVLSLTFLSASVLNPPTSSAAPPPTSVRACDQFVAPRLATCFAIRRTDSAIPHGTPSGLGPSNLRSAYNLGGATGGSGQTVGIIDAYDDPNAATDLAVYRAQFGLPACTTANGCFKKVNQSGATSPLPQSDQGWSGEMSLDVDMVSAICPNCHILLVEASSTSLADLGTSVNTAVALGAKFVSNSYGGGEYSGETSLDSSYYHHPGVVITASTGDGGYGVSYPAASQYVTAVGGTTLTVASNSRGWSESAWSGAGSGCSAYEGEPALQDNINTACANRADADVSAVADPNSGVSVYQTFGASGWSIYGGTSVSAPIIASVYALAGNPGSSDSPATYPYLHTGSLNDVTSGSNGSCASAVLCKSGFGWDGPTGLGTPNGLGAFTPAAGGTTPVTVTNPGSQTGMVGVSAQVQLVAAGGTGPYTYTATGLPGGLTLSAAGLVSGTPTVTGTFSVTVTGKDSLGATGTAAFSWTISAASGGGCTAKGQKLGNPGFETGSARPWQSTAGVISANGNGETAHAGTYFAWLDGYGVPHTDTLSQAVAVPANCSAVVSFYLHVDTAQTGTAAVDTMTVAAGSTTLDTFTNLDAAVGYAPHSYSVPDAAGKTLVLTFTGVENSALQTSFVIDDVALTLS